MTLPAPLIEQLRTRFGAPGEIRAVHTGPAGRAHRVHSARAGHLFLKHWEAAPAGMFRAEAEGLRALQTALQGQLRVPAVAGHAEAADGAPAWLALEWLEPGGDPDRAAQERLGRGLAALHRVRPGAWGWPTATFIGGLAQDNRPGADWPEFWGERRLRPQLEAAAARGLTPGRPAQWERLFRELPDRLGSEAAPALLHGDLWSGNVHWAAGGPALVDPALYAGHREADLAMMELFGGFPARALAAYQEAYPVDAGYSLLRRSIYQLYYLLVHVNLFGGGYLEQTARVLHGCLSG